MATSADWLTGWADAIPAFQVEELFDYPIFQRVETDNRQSATRTERLHCHG